MKLTFLFTLVSTIIFGQSDLKKEIEKIIAFDSDISYDLTPGFIVGVIDEDSTYFVSFGKSLDDLKTEITQKDIFELGSVSKTLTASLVFELDKKRILSIKDKVNDYLDAKYSNPRLSQLTIEDLLNHKTSFSKRPAHFGEYEIEYQNPYANYTKTNLLKYYSTFVPNKKEGIFNYSHTNYGLLEIIIEKACELSFHDAMLNYLFSSNNMNSSFVDLTERKENIITKGVDFSQTEVTPWEFKSFAASEGLRSNAEDLSTYIRSIFFDKDGLNSRILSKDIPTFNDRLFYTNGWHYLKINKKLNAYISNGNTSGHSTFIGMVPMTKTGVIVLSNSPFGTKDLGLLILRMINNNWKRKVVKNG
jgi:CubicO group peptidase (beta-lactamase class C family)